MKIDTRIDFRQFWTIAPPPPPPDDSDLRGAKLDHAKDDN